MSPAVSSKPDRQPPRHFYQHPRHQQQQQPIPRNYHTPRREKDTAIFGREQYPEYTDDELSCKICLGKYNERSSGQRPRSLDCQHTFCESCLQHLLTEQRRQHKKGRAAGTVKCPLCKYRTALGSTTSVESLSINYRAIKYSAKKAGRRSQFEREFHDLSIVPAVREAKLKGTSKLQFIGGGTTGDRVIARRFENFHPPPRDNPDDDIWATLSRKRNLRLSDDDPSPYGDRVERGHRSFYSPSHDARVTHPSSAGVERDYRGDFSPRHEMEDRPRPTSNGVERGYRDDFSPRHEMEDRPRPTSYGVERGYRGDFSPRHEMEDRPRPTSYGVERGYRDDFSPRHEMEDRPRPSSYGVDRDYRGDFSPRHEVEDRSRATDHSGNMFRDLAPVGVFVGQLGKQDESVCSPSSIDCTCDGRLVVVDADTGSVQIFGRHGDYLSGFRVTGARRACFIEDAVRGESLAVVTNSGVSICDQTGRVDKHLPIGNDVVSVSALHRGGVFVAAHRDRVTICDRYKPTAVLRSVNAVRPLNAPLGHPGHKLSDVVALATTNSPRLYVVDGAAVLVVDMDSSTLLESITAVRQPSAVAVDPLTGSVFIADSHTRRVMQFDVDGRRRCVAELPDDGGRCVDLAAGPPGPDGHQLIYVVHRNPRSAEVRIYQL